MKNEAKHLDGINHTNIIRYIREKIWDDQIYVKSILEELLNNIDIPQK